jgi:uncharacterized membrane-anchored protein
LVNLLAAANRMEEAREMAVGNNTRFVIDKLHRPSSKPSQPQQQPSPELLLLDTPLLRLNESVFLNMMGDAQQSL